MNTYITSLFLLFSLTLFGQSTFQKIPPSRNIPNRSSIITPITATIPYQGYEETQPYLGQGEYEIFLDSNEGILDKPIIVLDGFDPGDTRDVTALYNSLTFDNQNIGDIVRNQGFDIIVLNAPQYTTNGKDIDGGGDYIQRNAMVLIALIDLINAEKIGNEELVVLGPSMGGLIARYALSYMEDNNLDHETRLFISFDAPHRGANVPISLQYLVNYLAQEFDDVDAQAVLDDVLNSPAAKEMLVDHLVAHLLAGSEVEQDPTKLFPEGAPNFRDAFQTELDNLGFPENVRNVAMINGSGNSTLIGTPGMEVINTTLNVLPGTTADINLKFMPAANEQTTVIDWATFFINVPIGSFSAEGASFASTDGVDSAPGGTSTISSALGDGGPTTNPLIEEFVEALNQDEFCFIPTISSLAIENEDWYIVPDLSQSPFDATYIPDENEEHVSVTSESAQFAIEEIGAEFILSNDLQTKSYFKLLKNPIDDQIVISINNPSIHSVETRLYSVDGTEILHKKNINTNNYITIKTTMPSGVYLLVVTSDNTTETFKIIKK